MNLITTVTPNKFKITHDPKLFTPYPDLTDVVKALREFLDVKFIIGGGSVFDWLQGDKFNDVDVYFENEQDLLDSVAKFNDLFENKPHDKFLLSAVPHVTKHSFTYVVGDVIIQLIKVRSGDVMSILGEFDLTCCMVAMNTDGEVIFHPEYTSNNEIKIKKVHQQTPNRYLKYIKKGCDYNIKYFVETLAEHQGDVYDYYTNTWVCRDDLLVYSLLFMASTSKTSGLFYEARYCINEFLELLLDETNYYYEYGSSFDIFEKDWDKFCADSADPRLLDIAPSKKYLKTILFQRDVMSYSFEKYKNLPCMQEQIKEYPEALL